MPDATALDTQLLSYKALAAMLDVSEKTVSRMAKSDPTFPRKVLLGTRVKFRTSDVLAWIAGGGPKPAE